MTDTNPELWRSPDAFTSFIIFSSGIGYTLSTLISLLLLCHLLFICRKSSNSSTTNTSNRSKTGYILIIIYFFVTCITGIIYSSLRSNTVTGTDFMSQFTSSRCLYGVIFGYIFHGLTFMMLNLIFLHRIYIIFRGSAFAYSPLAYRILLILILGQIMLSCTAILIVMEVQSFTVKYDPFTNIAFCAANGLNRTIIAGMCRLDLFLNTKSKFRVNLIVLTLKAFLVQ